MSKGHISLPRSLIDSDEFNSFSLADQSILITLLSLLVWGEDQKFNNRGEEIWVKPGEIIISERELVKQCHKSIKRITVQRAIKKFLCCLIFVEKVCQKVSHKKRHLILSHQDTYDLIYKKSEPEVEPKVSQKRAIKEEIINNKYLIEKIYKKENSEKIEPISEKKSPEIERSDNIESVPKSATDAEPAKKRGKKKFIKANFKDILEFPPHVWFPKDEYEKLQKEIKSVDLEHLIKEINYGVQEGKYKYSDFSNAVRKWYSNGINWKNLPSFSNQNTSETDKSFAQRICREYESINYELYVDDVKLTIVHKIAQGRPIELKFGVGFKEECQREIIERQFIKKTGTI